jgi:hypothetical protein
VSMSHRDIEEPTGPLLESRHLTLGRRACHWPVRCGSLLAWANVRRADTPAIEIGSVAPLTTSDRRPVQQRRQQDHDEHEAEDT